MSNPIRQLRAQTGITQKTLAHLAGTSQPTVAAYEAGEKSPTLLTLEKLASSLGLEVAISFVPPLTREDLRSLAYHQAVVKKLKMHPRVVLEKARVNLKMMTKKHPHAQSLFDQWREWLNLPLDELIMHCLGYSLLARDMRQVTPFAGVLSANERLKVIKELRKKKYE